MGMLRKVSLRGRVTALAATVAVVLVAVMAVTTFLVVRQALYGNVDTALRNRAASLTTSSALAAEPRAVATFATAFTTDINVALMYPDGTVYAPGEPIPIGDPEIAVAAGLRPFSLRTVRGQRILAEHSTTGVTLVLSQKLDGTQAVLDHLALVLGIVGGIGVFFAAAAGAVVGRTGLRPVSRLTAATERVAKTNDLALIPVTGNDELARLTMSFNSMLRALAESRERQSRLVADAGHELKTPLTSLRTNMELLIAVSRPGARSIPDEDMTGLRDDVMGQLEELSTLVTDLVDLAREDSPELVHAEVDLLEVLDRALDRVRRRRADIDFRVWAEPWTVYGDPGGYSRAVLNVLDNAAKWSPPGEHVEVMLRQIGDGRAELLVGDAGPGIPAQDRQLVFERFYRSTDARSMPGSGLGLAIVRQVVQKYGGSIEAGESDRGGALIRIVLPGAAESGGGGNPTANR
ncbi:HAMP domain-containing sensor histidine kinase [Tomitella biformata]|uniref:HAMP domain-containing sensor histidine kinase n=1 Tax=Tomitella biformata TaxID=630403 RepID=UPI0009FEB759|nr:HAMP domain-containing sensor histidine kinase [Tomitella biformata]